MQVIATAGHVDHGKSTLIRALTGIDPDRLAEEKQRGLTIDLGFAWTSLPSGREVSFVDVPGHERFLGNMLAGIGPAPIVCFVIAADEGWQAQSSDHRDAIAALGIDQGLIAVTRADLAPEEVDRVIARARTELAGTGLADAPAVGVSAITGQGLEELRDVLDGVVGAAREPSADGRVRLWVDRAFSIPGAGTVGTGTLDAGTLRREDSLALCGAERGGEVLVRGLQSRGGSLEQLGPVSRAAVNLRGVSTEQIGRGDALLSPHAWELVRVLDVRRRTGTSLESSPQLLVAHIGTASVGARIRPLGPDHARLTLDRALPLQLGDRLVLRSSGSRSVRHGVQVLDLDPPALDRRGAGARRRAVLAEMPAHGDPALEARRRGAVRASRLLRCGMRLPTPLPGTVHRHGDWLVDAETEQDWVQRLKRLVAQQRLADPLTAGLPRKAAIDALALPDEELLDVVTVAAGLVQHEGRVRDAESGRGLGPAEAGVRTLEERLSRSPFAAPEADDLTALGLGPRELAAAAAQRRLLRLPGEVILLPSAPALAMRDLAALPQPFTTSQARQALRTTRRVAIPLLEHLDDRGWTHRPDPGHREVVR